MTETMPDALMPSALQSQQAGDMVDHLSEQQDRSMVTLRVPQEMAQLLAEVMPHVARGEHISFVSMPEDLTTTTAAAMLGMSRPTLMKLVKAGVLPSHKVGTHTRLRMQDVKAYRSELMRDRRRAYDALLAMDDEAGIAE